jgi:receptor protein-tyrosine kinase
MPIKELSAKAKADQPLTSKSAGLALTTPSIGQLLLEAGKLTEEDIPKILQTQRQRALRFGDTACLLGLVTEKDVQYALSHQYQYCYSPSGESALSPALFTMHEPFSAQAEALRALRTQVHLRWFQDRSRALAMLSPRSGEGCSTLTANLAVVFAQLGERTLLIDANLRKPKLHHIFGDSGRVGLSGLLAGRSSLEEAVTSVAALENLSILCAGPVPPNPQELLGRVSFSYIIETLPSKYDVVIIDAPAVLDYADAQIIAARAGGCVLVTRRHSTRMADVEQSLVRLRPTGASMLGCVINQ